MKDNIQKAIEDLEGAIKRRQSEVINLRNHGFITQKEYDRVCKSIREYYDPMIKALHKEWRKKYGLKPKE